MNRSTQSRLATLFAFSRGPVVAGVVGAFGLAGCYSPGGNGFSTDTHTYVSTSWLPVTPTLKDNRTGQALWSADVPVGKQLVIKFREGDGIKGSDTPDLMEWQIMDAGETTGGLKNSMPCPISLYRLLEPQYRPAPELPTELGGAAAMSESGGR